MQIRILILYSKNVSEKLLFSIGSLRVIVSKLNRGNLDWTRFRTKVSNSVHFYILSFASQMNRWAQLECFLLFDPLYLRTDTRAI